MAGEQGIPVLQEHQAAQPEGKVQPANYTPTDDEKKLLKKVEKIWEKNRNHRNNYDANWMDDYRFFRGRQWSDQRPSFRHSEVVNLVFQVIQSQVPILTDSRPKFEYVPQEPQDREFAEFLNEISIADWQANSWLHKLTEVIYDSHIYGTGMAHLEWDPDMRDGTGGIDFSSEELFYCYPDVDAEDVNVKSRNFVLAKPMDLSEVKRRWPEKGKFVKDDTTDLLDPTKNDLNPLRFRSPKGDKAMVEVTSLKSHGAQKKVLVQWTYFFDDEFSDHEVEGENGEKSFEQRLDFPNGRRAVTASGVVLEDGPNPYADGEFPWQRLVNYILPREFWGESEIAQIRGPQKIFNKIYSFALDVMTLMGNPIWVVDNDSGIDTDLLTNSPGLVVEKNAGSEARRETGVQLQPFVFQMLDRVKEYVDQIAGAQDITRGLPPGGVTAASAIADLQNAAQTRLRQKSRNIDTFLQDMGQQYASRVMQFYTAPRAFNYVGADGVRKYFKAHIEKKDDGQQVAVVQRFDDQGQPSPQMDEYILRGKLDVRVTTGTALPFSKAQKKEELLQLLDRGIIDAEEYFKQTDYPNWEVLVERLREQAAAQAEAEAQAQAQGQAPA